LTVAHRYTLCNTKACDKELCREFQHTAVGLEPTLIPVEAGNPARSRAAVAEAISIYVKEPVKIHLLSVQPAVSGHVAMFFGGGELHQLQYAAGAEDLASAQAQLAAAGVPYESSVRIGRSAETIARTASELGCDRILMGQDRAGSLAARMFGSLTHQVRQIVSGSGDCQVIGS
jgi:nucleotide-binding universal stress UspA family protein